ncbi:2-phospho-L-lactate transferase [Modestobacter sp. SYSU DS0511]
MHIVVLAGGVGGARFLRGVTSAAPGAQVTAVVNTGDDVTMHGLRICPDLDTVMYTLGDGIDDDRGWGRRGETWTVKDELAAYGAEPTWFGLGDRDLATHLVRTRMLDAGYPLSEVTAALADRWRPGVRLLPMSDQRVETHVVVTDPDTGRQRAIHFQEWWVRHRAALEARAFVQVGVDDARPAPGVVEALGTADVVLLAPSNPVVSIGTILGVPGVREALRDAAGRVVGLSPVVGGEVVRGMADRCLPVVGVEVSAEGVGRHYGARRDGGLLDAWLVHTGDAATVPGVAVHTVPLLMSSPDATRAMARAALDAAAEGPRPPHPSPAQGGPLGGATSDS